MGNEKEAAWEAERVGVYLSQHLKTFCDVLDIKLNDVAKKIDRPLSNISRLFATGTVTPDWYKLFDKALPELVKEAKDKLRTSGGIASGRIDEAERLIEGGCEKRLRTLMLLGESALSERYLDASELESERRKMMASLLQFPQLAGSVSEDEAVYEIAKKPYPWLEPDRLGFVYHQLGDAVLESAGKDGGGHMQAMRLYRKAVSHNASALINDYVQLMRCYMRTIKYEGNLIAREQLNKETRDLAAKFDILSRVVPIPCILIAEEYKAHAEWLERLWDQDRARAERLNIVFESDTAGITDSFERASHFYKQALYERAAPGSKPPEDADTAHLQLNIGYCLWMTGRFSLGGRNQPYDPGIRTEADLRFREAEPHMAEALRLNAVQRHAANCAYSFKYLAWLHSYLGHRDLAHWCINASIAVYKNSRTKASDPDKNHAYEVKEEIVRDSPTDGQGLFPTTDDLERLTLQYFKKRI